ncbi:cytochrome c [Xanthomonas sp. GPE 39]|uniref:cytochrome c n=1 Tax=Xanthomonas sp. GPE 39 TaxID=1583099 RepID=UPI0005F2F8C3|nr:cytochrome c [Xanthomonas sp. GPE 39]
MTTSPPHTAASRYLLVLIAGILIGLTVTVVGLRVVQARQDPFPRSLMQVMSKQLRLLERARALHHCNTPDTQAPLHTLRLLSGELDTAFPELNDDSRFREHAAALRAQVETTLATPPADCTALAQARQAIEGRCDACHRDFR